MSIHLNNYLWKLEVQMTFRKDRLLAVVIAVCSALAFIPTLKFTKEASYYPRAILGIIVLLCIPLWIRAPKENTVRVFLVVKNVFTTRDLLYVICAIAAFVAFMKPIGLYIELPVFTAFVMYRLGYKNPKKFILISLVLTAVVYLLFSALLKINIPMGLLRF